MNRPKTLTETVSFRVSHKLNEQLREKAATHSLTGSQFIRLVLERAVTSA